MKKFLNLFFITLLMTPLCFNAQDKPNILWLTSEDNSIEWVGCYGNSNAETPNIDALAKEGFRYTHCYANTPVCAPTRSTWITGVNALSMGTQPMRSRYDIPHDIIKYYPDYLNEAGYFTGNSRKTDYNIGGRPDKACWDDPGEIDWDNLQQKQPFFQVINFAESHESRAQGDVGNTIHDPNKVKLKAYHPDLPDVRKNYAKYHDAVKRMDSDLGSALKRLEELGLADNTIVIYNSDHGGVLPRSKRYLFATGIHVPLIIRIPEKYKHLYPAVKPNSIVNRMVSFVDMPKTWLSITGAKVPDYMQGTTFLGPEIEPEQSYHFAYRGRMDERYDNSRAVYDKEFVYIRNYMPYVPWVQHLEYQWKMKASVAWENYVKEGKGNTLQTKFFYPKNYTEELYKLDDDWSNTNNLIGNAKYSNKIESMRKALRKWQLKIHDSGMLPESEIAKRAKDNNVTIYELVRNNKMYNLLSLLDASDLALEQNPKHIDQLRIMLESNDNGLRYWGMVGAFLLNDAISGLKAINDKSDEVRVMAAWTLIRTGNKQLGLNCIENMLKENSYVMLKILNVIDWMGEDGYNLMNTVNELFFSGDTNEVRYKNQMRDFLNQKFEL